MNVSKNREGKKDSGALAWRSSPSGTVKEKGGRKNETGPGENEEEKHLFWSFGSFGSILDHFWAIFTVFLSFVSWCFAKLTATFSKLMSSAFE